MGMNLEQAFGKGWIRMITDQGDQQVFWDGQKVTNAQRQTLNDVAATLGYTTYRDQDYRARAALGLGSRELEKVKVDVSEARPTAAYWMDKLGSLYDFHKLGISSHTHFAQDVLGMKNERAALMAGWVRIRTIGGTLGFGKQVMYQGTSLSNKQNEALKDLSVYLGAPLNRDTEGGMGLGARAAERPTVQPMIGIPFALHKPGLKGQRFAPHFTRSWWDWVNMSRFYSGAARVFDKLPGLEYMGQAIRKHLDLRAAYRGEFLNRAASEFKGASRSTLSEYKEYWINNQMKGRNYADNQPISPQALKLVNLAKQIFTETGQRAVGKIKIYDPRTKTWMPFQPRVDPFKDYHPHMLREDIRQILHNPASDPEVWNELQDEMIAEGIIPGIDPDAEMLKHVDNYMRKFTVNGFFGSLERMRVADMPTMANDFSHHALFNYIESWAERMAQTEAFGQGVGGQRNLFDLAIKDSAGDKRTVNYIKHVRGRAYGEVNESLLGRFQVVLSNLATAGQLGSFFYTGRNLVFGAGFNWAHFGTPTYARSILNLKGVFDAIKEGKEKGIIMEDMMKVMQDGETAADLGKRSGKIASFLLKAHGNNIVEAWLRGTAMRGARIALRQAIRRYGKNPKGRWVRQFIGYLDNLGFKGLEAHNLLLENGQGPLTDRYLRAAVIAVQGGYSYGYVPLIADSPEGKFWLRYQKFGLERLQDFALNVSKPFLRAARLPGTKQVVTIMDKQGNPVDVRVPAGMVPMLRYFMVLAGAGAGWEWIAENIFGILPRTASWAEIMNAMNQNQRAALVDAAEKVFGYLIQAGAVGILGNYAQLGMDIGQRFNFKNPFDPSALAPITDIGNALIDFFDQGLPTSIEDGQARVDKLLEKVLSGYKREKQIISHAVVGAEKAAGVKLPDDIFGIHRSLELQARRREYNFVRAATRRYDREIGVRENVRSPGTFGGTRRLISGTGCEDLILGTPHRRQENPGTLQGLVTRETEDRTQNRKNQWPPASRLRPGRGAEIASR
jgi:hypothetical protein